MPDMTGGRVVSQPTAVQPAAAAVAPTSTTPNAATQTVVPVLFPTTDSYFKWLGSLVSPGIAWTYRERPVDEAIADLRNMKKLDGKGKAEERSTRPI